MRIDEDLGRVTEQDRRAVVAAYAEEPERDDAVSFIVECWQTLDSERPIVPFGMGGSYRGAIPWGAVRDWAQDAGLHGDEVRLLAQVIRRLDADRSERISNDLATKG